MTTTVEVQFDGSNWDDITSYLRNVSIRRGRANDLSMVDPGTLTVELDNNDGRFTPTNTQGAYYPNVKPAVAVRVTVNAGAGPDDYRLFTGKAQRWEPRWDVGGRPVVVLEAVDGFEQLTNYSIDYAHREVIAAATPDGYWPLDDTVPFADRSGNGRPLQTKATTDQYESGQSALVSGGPGSVKLSLDISSVLYLAGFTNPPTSWFGESNDLTTSTVFRYDTLADGDIFFLGVQSPPEPLGWGFGIDSDQLYLSVFDGVAGETLRSSTLSWSAETTYQVGFHWDQSTSTVTFYRNGAAVGSDTASTVTVIGSGGQDPNLFFGRLTSNSDEVRFSELAFWASDQSAQMAELGASVDGFASDSPSDRIGRVLDWAGWDASDRDIDDGTTPLAAITAGTALSACQDAAAADGGVFYIAAEGDATFQGRRDRWEDPSGIDYSDRYVDTYGGTLVDFDDDGTDTGYQTVGWRFDTTLLSNRVVVNSNTQGTSDGVAEDSTSQDDYDKRTLTIPTISNNSADNRERARWELSRRKDPHLRLEEVGFLVADAVQEDAAGSLELQSLVEVNRRPGSGQDDLTVQMRVASIGHTLSDGGTRWDARFGLLEADTDQPGLYGTAVYGTDYYGY